MTVVKYTALLVFCVCIYLMVSTAVGVPRKANHAVTFANQTTLDEFCDMKYPQMQTTLFVLEAASLLYGAYLCYRTKDVPDAINESSSVSGAILLLLGVCSVVLPVVFLVNLSTQVQEFIKGIAFAIATAGSLSMVSVPKIKYVEAHEPYLSIHPIVCF